MRPPWFSYQTRGSTGPLTPGEHCEQGTSSISGVAFVPTTSTYPAQYRGAMFFNDFARSCVWLLGKKANGDPEPTQILPFVQRAESPVQIKVGPGGDLFYVDYGVVDGNVVAGAGAIHRIVYTTGNHAAGRRGDRDAVRRPGPAQRQPSTPAGPATRTATP